MASAIKYTVYHVIQHDKEEIFDLIMELRDEVDEEFLDTLHDLELLAGKFLIDEFQEGKSLAELTLRLLNSVDCLSDDVRS